MSRSLHALFALVGLALAACDRPAERPVAPTIALSADALSFIMPADGLRLPLVGSVAIRNAGSGTLSVPVPSIALAAYQNPAGVPQGWLSARVIAEPGGYRLVVTPTVRSGDCFLPGGDYVATIVLEAPGAVNSPRTVQVTLKVPGPQIAPLPAGLHFTEQLDGSDPAEQVLALRGRGGYAVPTVFALDSWVTPTLAPVAGGAGDHDVSVKVSTAALAPGTHRSLVGIVLPGWGPAPDQAPRVVEVPVELVVPPPNLVLEPGALFFTAHLGSSGTLPPSRTFTASIVGRPSSAVPVLDAAAPRPSWLSAAVDSTAPFQVRVTPDVRGLGPGDYTGELALRLDGAGNSPLTLPVYLTVLRASPIASADQVFFETTSMGDSPPRTVQISAPDADPMPAPALSVFQSPGEVWLSAALTGTAPPYALRLAASGAGLAPGMYFAAVRLVVPGYQVKDIGIQLAVSEWARTSPVAIPRLWHTATALADGRVLVAGGDTWIDVFTATTDRCEIYDPGTDTWAETGRLSVPRSSHAATLLRDGRVLLVGGTGTSDGFELFDPATGRSSPAVALPSGFLPVPTATELADGRVLLTGSGFAFVFDPERGEAVPTGAPARRLEWAAAGRLPSGRVLVAGGRDTSVNSATAAAEIYDPVTGLWSPTGSMAARRAVHALVPLPDGRVLAAGGYDGGYLSSAEVYDEATGSWSPVAGAAGDHAGPGLLLPSGKVLLSAWPAMQAEVFDPGTGSWSGAGAPQVERIRPTLTLLPGGRPLMVGGESSGALGPPFHAELHGVIP